MNKTKVAYDGNCYICNAFKQNIEGRNLNQEIDFISYHDISLEEFHFPTQNHLTQEIHVLSSNNVVYTGARGVFYILSLSPGLLGLIGKLLFRTPLHYLAQPIYALIAKYRYIIFPRKSDAK